MENTETYSKSSKSPKQTSSTKAEQDLKRIAAKKAALESAKAFNDYKIGNLIGRILSGDL